MRIEDIDVPATILAFAALATAIGVPALISTRRSRRAARQAAVAVASADAVNEKADTIIRLVRPTNGTDTLGDEVREQFDHVNQRLEDMSSVVEANAMTTRMMVELQQAHGFAIGDIRRTTERTEGQVAGVEEKLAQHLEDVAPLTKWVSGQSGIVPGEERDT